MALTSPSINSLVIRTNVPNASVAPPNHRERRPAPAEQGMTHECKPQDNSRLLAQLHCLEKQI